MPLEDHLPLIDDRRYDDIVTEIRTRIARYAPEWRPGDSAWTDVNDNDPGVTIAQVYAWLAEMLIYRMNKVPALNYIKFLELIGVELRAAEPANAEIQFPVKATHPQPIVIVPSRTQLSADPDDGSTPLIFETVRAITCRRAMLDAVYASDGYSYTDVTEANKNATDGFQPFGPLARAGAELAFGFIDRAKPPAVAAPLQAGELDLAIIVQSSGPGASSLGCGAPMYPPATLAWEYWDGARWQPLGLLRDETLALTRSGHVHVLIPTSGIVNKTKLTANPKEEARYWLRARLADSQYERIPSLLAVRTNTVPVEQAETIRNEILGGSDGSRNQTFRLGNTPVLKGSLALHIQQSEGGPDTWTEVDDLFGNKPTDMVYVLDRTTGAVRTGDGVNGEIPVAYLPNAANVVAHEYRTGGGKRGNVKAGVINTLVTPIIGIDDNAVGNLQAAHDGREEETIDEAKERAPQSIRSRNRAVTAEDFEQLAKLAGNVKRAKALPMFHPQFPNTEVPGSVTVIVVPDSADPMPLPSDGLLRSVCACLDTRRLVTAELYVMKPTYVQVSIQASIIVANDADLAEVSQAIRDELLIYFHPLTGGEDKQGWPFGGTIYYSRVYQQVFEVEGVGSIITLTILVDGSAQPACTDVPIPANALVYSTDHAITVSYDFGAKP